MWLCSVFSLQDDEDEFVRDFAVDVAKLVRSRSLLRHGFSGSWCLTLLLWWILWLPLSIVR